MTFIAIRIVNNPGATHYTQRYLTHLGSGLLVGDLNARTRTQLIEYLDDNISPGDYIAAWPDPTQPQRWTAAATSTPTFDTIDGIILSIITKR